VAGSGRDKAVSSGKIRRAIAKRQRGNLRPITTEEDGIRVASTKTDPSSVIQVIQLKSVISDAEGALGTM